MKITFTFLSALLFMGSSHGQITIQQSNYTNWQAGADSLRFFLNPSGLGSLPAGAGQTWDLSGQAYVSGAFFRDYQSGTSPDFQTASYFLEARYELFQGLQYATHIWSGISAAGIESFGETMDRAAYSLTSFTFGPNDSLVFPQQVIPYNGSRKELSFPASYTSRWNNSYYYHTDFTVTAFLLSFNNTPGQRRTYVSSTDSVSGWGKVIVHDPATGMASDSIPVLQVQRATTYTDSIYLNGDPADPALLASFGLSQGMETYIYEVMYFRPGEVTPLLTIVYNDPGFTSALEGYVHTENISSTSSLREAQAARPFTVFPNPSGGTYINCSFSPALEGHTVQYKLFSVDGRLLETGDLEIGNTTVRIEPRSPLEKGMYLISVSGGKEAFTRTFTVE